MKQTPVSRIGLFVGFLDTKKLLIQIISILRKHHIFTLEIKAKIHKLVRLILWFIANKLCLSILIPSFMSQMLQNESQK